MTPRQPHVSLAEMRILARQMTTPLQDSRCVLGGPRRSPVEGELCQTNPICRFLGLKMRVERRNKANLCGRNARNGRFEGVRGPLRQTKPISAFLPCKCGLGEKANPITAKWDRLCLLEPCKRGRIRRTPTSQMRQTNPISPFLAWKWGMEVENKANLRQLTRR